jgi:hypothetical protein
MKLAVPVVLLILSYALFFGYLAATYRQLPTKVASHFDIHGQPNGWMSRRSDAEIMVAIAVIVPAIVVGSMGGAGRIPVSFINLPRRDFWLAPERRQSALAVLLRYSLWFAALNVLFLTGLHSLTVEANLPKPHHLDMPRLEILAALYLAAAILWTLLLLHHFSKVR